MKSFSGGMQLHYNRLGGAEPFEYTFEAPQAGKYALTAQVVTVNKDQHLLVAANGGQEPVDIAVPYTVGMWQETKPVEISLVKGQNVLHFTRNAPHGRPDDQAVLADAGEVAAGTTFAKQEVNQSVTLEFQLGTRDL